MPGVLGLLIPKLRMFDPAWRLARVSTVVDGKLPAIPELLTSIPFIKARSVSPGWEPQAQ